MITMKFINHFKTITKHKYVVFRHCIRAGIWWQGLWHDMSKYSPTEFLMGGKYYTGEKSPTEYERRDIGYSLAWMHHKGRNRHHYEYWTDYNPDTKKIEPVKMPIRFLKEMFCDRVSASKVYLGDKYTDSHPAGYFLNGSAKDKMHPDTAELLGKWLVMLRDEGEDAVFKEIRKTDTY